MAGSHDGVVLTERERTVLADMAATLDDPWLALQLTGGEPVAPVPRRQERWLGWLATAMLVVNPVLVILFTLSSSLPVRIAGVVLAAAAGCLLCRALALKVTTTVTTTAVVPLPACRPSSPAC